MSNTKKQGNTKLASALCCLVAAVTALNINAELHKNKNKPNNNPQSYLKNCALKTALERTKR